MIKVVKIIALKEKNPRFFLLFCFIYNLMSKEVLYKNQERLPVFLYVVSKS